MDLKYLRIWVLGSEHRSVEKSIAWDEDFPYFSNADVLIINTNSLSPQSYENESGKFTSHASRNLSDMLMIPNKKIIVILGGIVDWLPIFPLLEQGEEAEIKKFKGGKIFHDYMKTVKKTNYHIANFDSSFFIGHMRMFPKTAYDFVSDIVRHILISTNRVQNTGNFLVGCSITCDFFVNVWSEMIGVQEEHAHKTGEITFLPCPSEITAKEGIELLLNELIGVDPSELPPEWIEQVKLPEQEKIETGIESSNDEIIKLNETIRELTEQKKELTKYHRLLWTKGKALENIVFDAFQLLGFEDIRIDRTDELEDGIFDFQSSADFEHGILEVKGADNRTKLADLTQCNKWVEDYLLDDKKVKGVFVPNQHRLAEYPDSEGDRKHFEPNELGYAESRNICIIPSCELFNAVVEKISGNSEVTREKLEDKILNARGLCNLV